MFSSGYHFRKNRFLCPYSDTRGVFAKYKLYTIFQIHMLGGFELFGSELLKKCKKHCFSRNFVKLPPPTLRKWVGFLWNQLIGFFSRGHYGWFAIFFACFWGDFSHVPGVFSYFPNCLWEERQIFADVGSRVSIWVLMSLSWPQNGKPLPFSSKKHSKDTP